MDFDQILSQYRVVHVNIRGLNSNKQNLEHYLGEHNYPEIVTLNETMMNKNKGIKVQGYYCAARREPTGLSGKHGSMILVREATHFFFINTKFINTTNLKF